MDAANIDMARSFDRDGFVIVPDLFSRAEVKGFKAAIGDIWDQVANEAGADDKNGVLATGVYVGLAARSQVFRQAARDERLLDILEVILGPNIEFLTDKAVIKDPDIDYASPWHQDWPYWKGSHKISIWVALDDVTPDNGCLKLLPGSHRQVADHAGDASEGPGFDHRLRPDTVDEAQAITAAIEAGGAVFFHDLALHASHPNTTGRERWVWIPTYRDAGADDPAYSWAVANTVVRGTGPIKTAQDSD